MCINNELLAIYKSICFYLLTHSTAAGISESPSTAIGKSVFASGEVTLVVTSILEDVHGRLGFETPTFSLGPSALSVFLCFEPCLYLKEIFEIIFFRGPD